MAESLKKVKNGLLTFVGKILPALCATAGVGMIVLAALAIIYYPMPFFLGVSVTAALLLLALVWMFIYEKVKYLV